MLRSQGITLLFWSALVCFGQCTPIPRLSGQSQDDASSQHLARADEAYSKQDWKLAAAEYKEALRLHPNSGEALTHLGIANQKLDMPKEAESCFERALQLAPGLPEVDVLLGLVRIQLGKYREAIAPLEGAFDKTDYDLAVRSTVGQRLVEIYFSLSEPEKSLAMVQKLRQLAPNDPDVLYTASKVYASLWNEAVQRMLAKAPDSYRIHQVLAEVAEAQQNYAEAAKEYRLIVKMAPELPGFHYRLGRAILESDTSPEASEEALRNFQEELKLNPRDAPAQTQIGGIYLKARQIEQAAHMFTDAIAADPSYVDARVGYAKALLEKKQFQEAAQQLEEAVRLSPDDETVYYNLMLAYRGLGRMADAQRAMANFQKLTARKQDEHASIMRQLKGAMGAPQVNNP
jgi:tetratricopeptide (TPR) repeat protein